MRTVSALLLAFALAPAGASADVGFGTPVPISPAKGKADMPVAGVGTSGRTVVVWRQVRRRHYTLRARLGPSPGALGPTVVLERNPFVWESRVAVAPDGTATACWPVQTYDRGRSFVRCATAPPDGPFGPPVTLLTSRPSSLPEIEGLVVDDAGRAIVAWSYMPSRYRRRHLWSALSGGVAGAPHELYRTEIEEDAVPTLATGPGGEVLIGYSEVLPGDGPVRRRPLVRTMPAGGVDFGPTVEVAPGVDVDTSGVGLTGGYGVAAIVQGRNDEDPFSHPVAAFRRPDGSFGPLVRLAPAGGLQGGLVRFLPDGTALSYTENFRDSGTDCSDIVRSAGSAGTISPDGTLGPRQRVTPGGQIAFARGIEVLEDGTVLLAWGDESAPEARVEYAVRPPGATEFGPGVPLPRMAARDVVLAAGARDALLVWEQGSLPDGPSRLVASPLLHAPPFAPVARRPAHPRSDCA